LEGHKVLVLARNKDVLTQLLDNDGVNYLNTHRKGKEGNLFTLFLNFINQYKIVKRHCQKFQPDVMIGTSFILPWISRKLKIDYINVVEDDSAVIPLYANLSFRFSSHILAPYVCKLRKWEKKKIGYNSYHEFAFLHPDHFQSNESVARKYLDLSKKNFIIRFTAFNAHHDYGKQGIDSKTADRLIKQLEKQGDVFITSEKEMPKHLERYRLTINPNDIHHVIAYSTIVIGDSQSMAMEAACLGVPSLRLNDYAGRISVLEELEHKYALTFGFLPKQKKEFFNKLQELLFNTDLKDIFHKRREVLLKDKINTHQFLLWLLLNYPKSISQLKKDKVFALNKTGGQPNTDAQFSLRKGNSKKSVLFIAIYFSILLFCYLFPLSDSISLNRYRYLSFRGDHIIHLFVFAPIPYLILPIFLRQTKLRWLRATLLGIIIAVLFELTHMFVPYRAFTLEDLAANIMGVLLGAVLLFLLMKTNIYKH
jgi:predicted glycosyltransferase/VanZ family protein